jgi:hypothetical protein
MLPNPDRASTRRAPRAGETEEEKGLILPRGRPSLSTVCLWPPAKGRGSGKASWRRCCLAAGRSMIRKERASQVQNVR